MWGLSQSPVNNAGPASPLNANSEEPTSEAISMRMQRMIDLQYASINTTMAHDAAPIPIPPAPVPVSAPPEYHPPITDSPVLRMPARQHPQARSILPPVRNYQTIPSDPEMGQGQLFFPSDYPRPAAENEFNRNQAQQAPHDTNEQRSLLYSDPFCENGNNDSNHEDSVLLPPSVPPSSPWCCLWQPFHQSLLSIYHAEALQRSFCYSAIDGLLTGAGILASFCGMRLLEPHSPHWVHGVVIATTVGSCSADAIGMAMSHMWSTHVMSVQLALERRDTRQLFHADRVNAKAKLVDMLLTRGMLRIDAMSIVDTLEGYPDLFVGALAGDGYHMFVGDAGEDGEAALKSRGSGADGAGLGQYRSYGQFDEMEHDPEAAAIAISTKESQVEAVVMFLSFSLFAVIPGLIFWIVGLIMKDPSNKAVSATSISVVGISAIMLLLGIWKR
jgi:hypothetical protein